jgi:voltage-gated potassium channel
MRELAQWPARNLFFGVLFVLLVGTIAVVAYVANGWSVGDAVYMVVLTVFSVGYDEVHPIDSTGLRAITIALIVAGCTGMIFLTGALVQFITLSQIQQVFGTKRMNRQIGQLRDHVVVCGFGRIGAMLAQELSAARAEFVIVELDAQRCAEVQARGHLCLQANASDEASLVQAGVPHARALATVVPSDAENVFITLSARALNPSLQIIARGESPATERKLLQAGANSVVMPAHIGAGQVASLILFPAIAGVFQDSARRRQMERDLRTLGLEMEVVVVAAGSAFAGMTVEEIERSAELTFFIVAIQHAKSGEVERPKPTTRVHQGDGVTLLGRGGRASSVARFLHPDE